MRPCKYPASQKSHPFLGRRADTIGNPSGSGTQGSDESGQGIHTTVYGRPRKCKRFLRTVRRNAVRCSRVSGLSIAAYQTPRARMEDARIGSESARRTRELSAVPWFSRSRLNDRCPLPVLQPAHISGSHFRCNRRACRSDSRRRLPVDRFLRHQRPGGPRHSIRQRHRDQHPRLARQHPGQP